MIKTISQAPNDNFTFSLFNECVSTLTCDFDAYYIWSNPPQKLKQFLTQTNFNKPNIVIGIKDLLDMWIDYNFWTDNTIPAVALLDEIASTYPDTNFIIFTSLENIELESIKSNNIQYVQWGGDIVNQSDLYRHIVPVLDKNMDSTKTFISLNRNRRAHRLVLLSYLFGKGYDQSGNITYLGQEVDTQKFDGFLDAVSWKFETEQDAMREAILSGYAKFYNNTKLATDGYEIYKQSNDNVTNFNQNLRTKYQNSFVEIVSESSFLPQSYMLTEKTLNSIYGCNFPIILSGVGTVAHLRGLGIDMFDDVVDHGYDTIQNPFDRIVTAVESNKQLLLDSTFAKQTWQNNRNRFEKNINIAQTIYDQYKTRAQQQFSHLKWIID